MNAEPGPNALLIGAARSGTTWLARCLTTHPSVMFTDPKETHFLAFAGDEVRFAGPGDTETINRVSITAEPAWRALFAAHADTPVRCEGSVSTLYYHDRSIANIERHCQQARMIVSLRDPVERAYSAYLYQVGRGYETESFDRALDLEDRRRDENWHHMWHYTRMSAYGEQLVAFLETFGPDRVLVVSYEELVAHPARELDRCFRFLGVEPVDVPEAAQQVNAGGRARSAQLQRAMTFARSVEPLRRVVKGLVPYRARERIRSANLSKPEMGAADRARLEEVLGGERRKVARLLGDDAPAWAVAT